jgi:hypothetical protein
MLNDNRSQEWVTSRLGAGSRRRQLSTCERTSDRSDVGCILGLQREILCLRFHLDLTSRASCPLVPRGGESFRFPVH